MEILKVERQTDAGVLEFVVVHEVQLFIHHIIDVVSQFSILPIGFTCQVSGMSFLDIASSNRELSVYLCHNCYVEH